MIKKKIYRICKNMKFRNNLLNLEIFILKIKKENKQKKKIKVYMIQTATQRMMHSE